MPTAKTVRIWYKTHKWTSLICTVFLLMSCITGLPLIFSEELDPILSPHVAPADVPAGTPMANLDRIVSMGQQKYPKEHTISLTWDDEEPRLFLFMSPKLDPGTNDFHSLVFDAHTGNLLEELKPDFSFLSIMESLHTELYSSLPGELFLGAMALLFVVSLISGAVVYGPFMRKLKFGTFRATETPRVRWFDLHNLLGIVTLAWALVVGATGVMNTLAEPLFDLWRSQEMPQLLKPYQGKPMPERFGSVDGAVEIALRVLPNSDMDSVGFPNPVFGSPRHYLVWTKGRTPLTSQLFTPVLIDAENGAVTQGHGMPWYLRALDLSRPLHFGDYGGLPLKLLWAMFDVALIAVLGSGLYLWFARRRRLIEIDLDALVATETETPATI